MKYFNLMTTDDMQIVQGRIVNIGSDSKLLVRIDTGGAKIACDFLRTSDGPLPQLYFNTPVLCILTASKGYVLGVAQPYEVPKEEKDPTELDLNAHENIELTCGKSMLRMDKEGNIILRGRNITSRAAGQNKIKGATIRIN